ncbi:MAG: hypothetical protein KF887_07800 [Paracoccaceae bacterium]|nr:MAG: hypothetical protein KF887_07800 [Paracoccaceae bacterium]
MARVREVGTLWIGGALSWLERLCLKSFVDQGQRITLFSYHDIPNVPEGVIRRDGREVLDTDNFLKYEKKDSFALFADLFRMHMLRACPGMIWVDTDVYCHRPMDYDGDVVMGFELPESQRVNNAVLGLPPDHPMLAAMLDFMADPFAVPPFLKRGVQADYRAAAGRGEPVHVSQMPWGTWGPLMVTHFAAAHGVLDKVQPLAAFYPIPFPDRLLFLRSTRKVQALLRPETTALHLWASNKRELGLRHHGLPPPGSYMADLCARHGIDPVAAPIAGRGKRVFDAGLLAAIDLPEVERFADAGGTAQSMALAAHARWGCAIDLIDIDHKGRMLDAPSAWVSPYVDFLLDHGVPAARIRRVGAPGDLRPAQVLAALQGFGDTARIKGAAVLLDHALAPGGRMLLDIRKGSGSFPFLKPWGEVSVLSTRDDAGTQVSRAVLARTDGAAAPAVPAPVGVAADPPPAAAPPDESPDAPWSAIATRLAGADGFYREGAEHAMLFVPRSPDVLVVTFDNLDIAMDKRDDRRPWGFAFIEKQGWSMLGVTAAGWTWFRDAWVSGQFDALRDAGFFARFGRVVFYGASMGGYGACAFSAACPGADVVAISPQSTLDRALVPWETRYRTAWGRDFSGPYGDAAAASGAARRVTLLYDPYEPLDAAHVARFDGPNVMRLRTPLLGHRLGSSLHQMGILSPTILGALGGTLTEGEFYRSLRARKTFPRYQRELFDRAVARGHATLARRMARWVLTRGDNRHIRKALAAM